MAIKPEELRLGNFVCTGKNSDGADEIGKVVKTETDAFQEWNGMGEVYTFDKGGSYWDCDEFFPIPLTEEWMLKFGFIFRSEGEDVFEQIWAKGRFRLWKSSNGFFLEIEDEAPLAYVHQLQNLYHALIGQELTA